jgi:hypothetical protein
MVCLIHLNEGRKTTCTRDLCNYDAANIDCGVHISSNMWSFLQVKTLGSKCSSRTSLFRQFDSGNRIKCWNSRTWLWLINSKSNFKLSTMLWFTNLSTTCLAQTYSSKAHCGEYWVSKGLVVSRNIIFTTADNHKYSIVSKHSLQFQTWDGPHDFTIWQPLNIEGCDISRALDIHQWAQEIETVAFTPKWMVLNCIMKSRCFTSLYTCETPVHKRLEIQDLRSFRSP